MTRTAVRAREEFLEPLHDPTLGDLRFRALLTDKEWASLPSTIRARFSKRLSGGGTTVYVGEVTEVWMSRAGWLLAQAARLIGGPFPTAMDIGVASVVTVTEDRATGGQSWTRLYARRSGFPQVIQSTKLFAGPTGLEEYVGCGISMALTVRAEDQSLVFRSNRYFLRVGGWRIALPRWVTPGALTVTHTDMSDGWFTFTLDVAHPLLGRLIRQSAAFRESKP